MSDAGQDAPGDLAAGYVLGALSEDERRNFEAHLAASPAAQAEVAELRELLAVVALAASEASPAPSLRDRVLAAAPAPAHAAGRARGRRGAWSSALLWGALAASLLAVVGLAVERGRLGGMLATRDSLLALREARLAATEGTLQAILGPGVHMYQLTSSGDPDPGVQLFWDQNRHRATVYAYRLKPAPLGRVYQLWFIRDGKPVPSVTFNPSRDGRALLQRVEVPADGAISAAAVTEEPASGSPQPTTPILLVGNLAR